MTGIILAAAIVGGTGLILGLFLGVSDQKLKVEVDEKEERVRAALPGNNCGGCGYAGCDGLAAAICKGEAELTACPVGGPDVAAVIGDIMGKSAGEQIHEVAFVKCGGTCEKSKQSYGYYGVEDCRIVNLMQNEGPKGCHFGCHGFGSCVKACMFDALHIVDGIAVVDREACKACKKCIEACPRGLIELIPYEQKQMVLCNSHNKGKDVMAVCSEGCIGCKLCVKSCEFEAISVADNIAHIDVAKCTNCGACAEKCPKHCITGLSA